MNRLLKRPTRLVPLLCVLLLSSGGGPRVASSREASRYSHRMHNRFYQAWVQPRSVIAPRGKISVQIDRDGRVRRFHIAQPSGYAAVDEPNP